MLDGNDTVDGGPENDYILGGDGGDALDGFEGDDTIDTGLGDPLFEFFDSANGGTGFNTITFASRPEGGSGVLIDNRPDQDYARDTDGSFESMDAMQVLIGTPNDDEMVGAYTSEVLIGGKGADTLCGGLGNDTVDYSSSTEPVRVTLDGDMPTDQDLGIQLLPDHIGESGEALRQRFFKARHDCRQTNPATGLPLIPGDRDCTADDGAWDGTTSEGDCVGEDVENIVGSNFDDILIGNDVDPLEGRGPRVEPLGANRIQGRDGDDVMDGRSGPDVYEGGAGTDTVTYGGLEVAGRSFPARTRPLNVTIDGVANDGGVAGP